LARVIKGCCRPVQVFCTSETYKPISQVALLKQNKNHKNDDDAGGRKRVDQRLYESPEHLERPGIWLSDLDRYRSVRLRLTTQRRVRGRRSCGLVQLLLEIF